MPKPLLENTDTLTLLQGETGLHDVVREHAAADGNRVAINFYGREIGFDTLDDQVRRLATALVDRGCKPGERIGVMLQPVPQCVVVYLAALSIGLVIVPIDPMSKRLELEHYLIDSGVSVLVTMDYLLETVQAADGFDKIRDVLATGFHDFAPASPDFPFHPLMQKTAELTCDSLSLSTLIEQTEPRDLPTLDLDAPAFILYTGGTTGLSKGCLHTHRDMLFCGNGQAQVNIQGIGPGSRLLGAWPLTHISGISALLCTLVAGGTSIMLCRWDGAAAATAYRLLKPNFTMLPVPCYADLLEHFKTVEVSHDALERSLVIPFAREISDGLVGAWKTATGIDMQEWGYGSSEYANYCATGVTLPLPRPACTTAGSPFPGVAIRIVDFDNGQDLAEGEIGEIVTRSPAQLKRYWNNPAKTAETIVDGWVHMNDRGYVKDGVLYFIGKVSEVVKVSGYTVSLAEIEVFGLRHDAIESIAAIGVPDPAKGQKIKAFVTLKPGQAVTAKELEDWFADNLAVFKCPTVELRQALPMSGAGKILKRVLATEEKQKRSLAD